MSVSLGPPVAPVSRLGAAGTVRLPAEDELVALVAPPHRSQDADLRCRALLGSELSWPLVLARAETHGVLPLVAGHLERLGAGRVPAAILSDLKRASRANAAYTALLVRELAHALNVLGRAGVPAIALKGVALAESLYGDPTLRVCSDLDILVPRASVRQAFDSLLASGYRPEFPERSFADLVFRHDIECRLERGMGGISYVLDLHWGIAWQGTRERLGMEDLWASARPSTFHGVEMYALSPEWQLLFLAVHAARHRWGALKWLVDIHEACVAGGIDWRAVEVTARRFGWEEALRISLSICHVLLDSPVPPRFSKGVLPPWVKLLPVAPMAPSPWEDAVLPLRLFRRPSEKLRYLARLALLPTLAELRLVRLPSPLRMLYYPLRPIRLAGKWAWHGLRSGVAASPDGLTRGKDERPWMSTR